MLTTTFAGRAVREPVSRAQFDEEDEKFTCPDCGDEPVSGPGEVCDACSVQYVCATCGKRVDPGEQYCDDACRAEDEAYAAGDARADLEGER